MGWFTKLRDSLETAAVVGGNYFLPGSSLLTSHLVSKGSQKQLGSDFGRLANLGAGVGGGIEGNLGNWGTAANAAGEYTGLNSLFTGTTAPGAGVVDLGTSNAGYGDFTGGVDTAPTSMTGATPAPTPAFNPDTTVAAGTNYLPTSNGPGMTFGGSGQGLTYNGLSSTGAPVEGTGLQATGFEGSGDGLGVKATPNAYGGPSSTLGFSTGGTGVAAPSEGYFAGQTPGAPVANPGFLASLGSGNFGDAAGAAGKYMANNPLGTAMIGSSLYDMYAKNKMAKDQENLYNQNRADILNMYRPGSPEAVAMEREMARKDAAAGRNSQYGVRAADFAGNVAKFRSNALSNLSTGQNAIAAARMGNQYGGLNSMFNNLAMYSMINKKTT